MSPRVIDLRATLRRTTDALTAPGPLPDYERVLAEIDARDLRSYIRNAWHVVEPTTPYRSNWHLDAISDHLSAVLPARQIRNLIISVPPRHSKSLSVSVFWPTWLWIDHPELRFLYSSYADSLSIRDSLKCRRVILSPWFQRRWSDKFYLVDDQNQKSRFENNHAGYRLATSVGGAATGEGGDIVVVDDPHNINDAHSETIREGVITWWSEVMGTRLNDPQAGGKVIIMQRVHEKDLVGHLLKQEAQDWEVLILPTEYVPTTRVTGIGFRDPRTRPGELLWPERMGPTEVSAAKRSLGSYGFSAQHQQNPTPASGGILPREWWKFYKWAAAAGLLTNANDSGISMDAAFKDLEDSSYVVLQAWCRVGARRYLLDQVREQMSFSASVTALKAFVAKWPTIKRKWIEGKANGPAIISHLEHEVPGLIECEPEGSKEARAFAAQPFLEAGNIFIPEDAPFTSDFLNETASFPKGDYDDQVDAFSQAMKELYKNEITTSGAGVLQAVPRVRKLHRTPTEGHDPRGFDPDSGGNGHGRS